MSVEQMTKMLDAVPRFYAQRFGIVLSDPPDRREPPPSNSNDVMANLTITLYCCLCSAKHEPTIDLPEGWKHRLKETI